MGAVRFASIVIATTLLCAASVSAQPTTLTLGTASGGGTYYVVGEAIAKILTEKAKVQVVPQQTQGPNQNMILIDDKKIELAMVTMGVALQGLIGSAPWTRGKKYENVRALFPMYDTPLQCVALKKSGIASFKQLDGKTVGTGPKAGTAGTYFPLIFEALGLKAQTRNGQSSDMANLLNVCLKKLAIMEEDLESLAAKDLHELLRAWELKHRHRAAECVAQHTLFRKETRWPGYYYRGDVMKVDDENWHVLTVSRRDPETGEYTMEKAPCYHLVEDKA